MWSFGLVAIGLFWPLTWGKNALLADVRVTLVWVLACFATAIFPSLPLDSEENLEMM
jgi:GPI ethanolamine phosphate transferase 1